MKPVLKRRASSNKILWAAFALVNASAACHQHPTRPLAGEEAPASAHEQDAPARAYAEGLNQLKRGLLQEAIRTFDDLKLRHPYSRFAALSELRAADAYARREEYLTAIDGYRTFLRFHPTHPDAAYALEQIGEAFIAQIPRDFWPLPPAAEKDLDATRQAIETFEDLLNRFSDTAPTDKARAHLDACRRKLGDHELMVARFYHRRGRWPGALGRARVLLETYGKLGFDAEAQWLAGTSLIHLGQTEEGQKLLAQLAQEHANTRWAQRAKKLLSKTRIAHSDESTS